MLSRWPPKPRKWKLAQFRTADFKTRSADLEISHADFGNLARRIFTKIFQNPPQPKYRSNQRTYKNKKMAWDHALIIANILQHLALHGRFLRQIRHLYSGAGGYKSERGKGSPSQSASLHCRGNTSCEKKETRTRSQSLNSPLWIVSYSSFPAIRSYVNCLYNQHLQ